jgi:hypothetical protein
MSEIVCDKVTNDIFLLYTRSFIQLYDGSRFITILGEDHDDMAMDLSKVPDQDVWGDGTKTGIILTQKDYIYRDMASSAPPTLIEMEVIPGLGSVVPSYNLASMRSAIHPTSFMVDDADIRRGIFHLPYKSGFWLDIILKTNIAHTLIYDECVIILKQVDHFYQYVIDDSSTPDSLKKYVKDNQKKNAPLIPIIKNSQPDKFNYTKYSEYFRNMQISVLDINILFNIYRQPMYSNIVIVCGYGHSSTLLSYFTTYVHAQVLSNLKADEQGYKNTVNLKDTYNPKTLEACIESLKAQTPDQTRSR